MSRLSRVKLINPNTGSVIERKIGFSWTVFFFGWFVPLFRGDMKYFGIMCAGGILLGIIIPVVGPFILSWVMCFMYNKFNINDLLEKGFVPASEADAMSIGVVWQGQ